MKPVLKPLLIALLATGLGACATLSSDGNEKDIRATAARLMGSPAEAAATTPETRAQRRDELLARPLSVEDAVSLALLNNPGLQKAFAELRLTEAEVVAATRPRNPGITVASLRRGEEREIERSIDFDLLGLLTLPLRRPLEKQRYEAARLDTTRAVLNLARETRQAYFAAIARQQQARYAADVQDAAEAARDLARSLAQAGNVSRLDAAREQAFYAEATAQRARADTEALVARERLTRLLGVTDAQAVKLPERLPDLPASPRELANVEQQALDQRIDVQLSKHQAASTARALRLSKVTRVINVLDLGYQYNSSNEQPTQKGFEVSLELPLFDFGSTRVAQSEAIYRRALAQVAEAAVTARSEAREAYTRYRTSYDLARHYRDEVVPLQQQISDEVLLRYNGMLISTFELLAQAREQVASTNAYLTSLNDFWQAEADLTSTLQGASGERSARAFDTSLSSRAASAEH